MKTKIYKTEQYRGKKIHIRRIGLLRWEYIFASNNEVYAFELFARPDLKGLLKGLTYVFKGKTDVYSDNNILNIENMMIKAAQTTIDTIKMN